MNVVKAVHGGLVDECPYSLAGGQDGNWRAVSMGATVTRAEELRKHGNTKVGPLRKEYGENFYKGRRKDLIKTLLMETGSASLHDYLKHHHK